MTKSAPILKKISKNGQIVLPKIYRDTYIQYREEDDKIILEPMFWDGDLEIWLTKSEYLDISGEAMWSAKENNGKGISIDNLGKNG